MDRLLKNESLAFKRRIFRLYHAVRAAITDLYDSQVVQWWLQRYMPDQTVFSMAEVYEMAIQSSHLPLLGYIYEETKRELPLLIFSEHTKNPDTFAWLLDHGGYRSCKGIMLHELHALTTSFQSLKRSFSFQDANSPFTIDFGEFAIDQALNDGGQEDLQWLHEHRQQLFQPSNYGLYDQNLSAVNILNNAIRYGNVDAAKWLVKSFPQSMFTDPKRTFDNDVAYLRSYRVNMDMVKWVLSEFVWRKPRNRNYWMDDARDYAARSGNLEMLKYVHKARMESCNNGQVALKVFRRWGESRSPVMDDAAALGRLDILQIFHGFRSRRYTTRAMNGAAANGHLDVVEWLHHNRIKGCTTEAMDAAAANGHLSVVQWLHNNRSEGCTTKAIDRAASNGHLSVVQWLHENRSEGFTRMAMDGAAGNGFLSVVLFLHSVCQEKHIPDVLCTTFAMDQAASSGHIQVVQWLHENRSEGCTKQAMDLAAKKGHLEIVQWLHENRAEGCTKGAMDEAAYHGHWRVVQFLHANRHEGCAFYAKAYVAAENGREFFHKLDKPL